MHILLGLQQRRLPVLTVKTSIEMRAFILLEGTAWMKHLKVAAILLSDVLLIGNVNGRLFIFLGGGILLSSYGVIIELQEGFALTNCVIEVNCFVVNFGLQLSIDVLRPMTFEAIIFYYDS